MSISAKTLCDEAIYSGVFREYSKTLFRLIYYRCGNEKQSQDLVQEAFLKLWLNCASVDKEKAKAYVFRTANNLMLNEFEHGKVKLRFQRRAQLQASPETPNFILEHKEFEGQLNEAISSLPEKQRVTFLLSRIDKKTYKEIGEILGISKQAVEKRIYKALDTLRKLSKNIR